MVLQGAWMGLRPQERERGLAALNEARQTRRRAIVFGRVRVREVATGFWLMTFVGLALFSFAYYRYTLVELDARRSEVAARQRAVATALGGDGLALRDKLEGWVMALAGSDLPERVAEGVTLAELEAGPVIYVRLALADARTPEGIRKGAARSLRDGFTSCLFVGRAGDPRQGLACTVTAQCGPGEVCSDWSTCAPPSHPYNLRLLYEGVRVLEPGWAKALEAAKDDLQVRAIELDLESVAKHEVVAAAELVRRSKYFTAVLDEMPADGVTPQAVAGESAEAALQATDHGVRVGIWNIGTGAPLAVLRLTAAGRFVRLGAGAALPTETLRVQQRQANNCAVATDVREILASGRLGSPPAGGAEVPAVPGE
jgi:hypothetical protein